MREYIRKYPLLSACGLNCGLCPRFYTEGESRCPGCGGKDFALKRPSCGILSCTNKHEIEYCYQCKEYPCKKYIGAENKDSFITHHNMLKDFTVAKNTGITAYMNILNQKVAILNSLLNNYNDGQQKSFFCIAVNLLDLQDISEVMTQLAEQTISNSTIKEKSQLAVRLFNAVALKRSISLKLNKTSYCE